MPFSFPSSPTVGQQSTQNGRVYAWTGTAWDLVSELASHVHSGADITSGTISADRLPASVASASSLTAGTLANARMTTRARAAMHLYLWSSFR